MRRILLALLVLVAPARAAGTPAAAVAAFYAVYDSQRATGGGIPDATGRLRYAAVLSPRLNRLLADAAAAQGRSAARVKSGGPKAAVMPMLEGDIFSSLFEGATGWTVGACQMNPAGAARCPVALTRAGVPNPPAGQKPEKPVHWTDTLLVVNTPQGWKVDDVVYDPGFAAGNTGQLSDMLGMVIAANP